MVETGIVRSVGKGKPGMLRALVSKDRVFFDEQNLRTFRFGAAQPLFIGNDVEGPPPRPGDVVVFERVHTSYGAQAASWGFYESYRETFAPALRECLPTHASEHPYLFDVIIAARRLFTVGKFTVTTACITQEVLNFVPVDDLFLHKLSYVYAVVPGQTGGWIAHELCSQLIQPKQRHARVQYIAHDVGSQLESRGLKPGVRSTVLVRLDVDSRVGLVPSSGSSYPSRAGVEERSLKIYV